MRDFPAMTPAAPAMTHVRLACGAEFTGGNAAVIAAEGRIMGHPQ
jgi:hypothetical protein